MKLENILEAVGKTTGQIRAQLGGSTEAIAEAVTQAKTLGMELSDVAAAGKQLLDFESSIAAQTGDVPDTASINLLPLNCYRKKIYTHFFG